MVVNLEINPVRIKIGDPKNGGTGSSIKLCFLMKFKFESDKALVSLVHVPGLGEGILCSGTGNQLADMSLCSLNGPRKKINFIHYYLVKLKYYVDNQNLVSSKSSTNNLKNLVDATFQLCRKGSRRIIDLLIYVFP